MKVLLADYEYIKTGRESGIDWKYLAVRDCTFIFAIPHASAAGAFENKWLSILLTFDGVGGETVTVIVRKDYAWDGASVVPDLEGVVPATEVHDLVYQFVDEIAKRWGWPVKKILALADSLFEAVMLYCGAKKWVVWSYYKGVSWFGYTFNRFNVWKRRWFGAS